MRHAKPVRLKTAPTALPFGRHCFQLYRCGAVKNRTYRGESAYLFLEFTIISFGRLSILSKTPFGNFYQSANSGGAAAR